VIFDNAAGDNRHRRQRNRLYTAPVVGVCRRPLHRPNYKLSPDNVNGTTLFSNFMSILTKLLSTEPIDDAAIAARLEGWGFVEAAETVATARANTSSLPRRRTGALPRSRPRTSLTANANKPGATPTARAAKLVAGLARNENEREVLASMLDDLLEDLSRSADPMRALLNFSRLCDGFEHRSDFFARLQRQPELRSRLARLLGFSQALADTLIRDVSLLELLAESAIGVSRPELRRRARAIVAANPSAKMEALRRFRRVETLRIGLLDLDRQTWRNVDDFTLVVQQISDLAQVCVQETLELVGAEMQVNCDGFAVLAMGKLGARELNYSSDIDLIFIHDGPNDAMQKLGQNLLKALSDSSIEGALYRVDMRLRPEGQAGPLTTSIGYAFDYYESYAGAWEWQALIKARSIAGDARLARRFRRFTRGITWARRTDDAHLREILEMKRRSEGTAEGSDDNNVKQGPGAIRDSEWVVQQLQMMVGPQHPRARASSTLRALKHLLDLHAITPDEARTIRDGYLYLRVLEHRLQLLDDRAVRTLPEAEKERSAIARRMGCLWRNGAATRWLNEEHTRHRKAIRALCEHMFWGWRDTTRQDGEDVERPRGPEYTGMLGEHHETPIDATATAALQSESTQVRLRRLAEGTAAHPVPAPLARQIGAALPDALRELESATNPERAVANLERLCEASGNRLSLLRSLGSAPALARAVFTILGGSEFLSDTLIRFPELLDLAAQRPLLAQPKDAHQARADCRSYCLTFRDRAAAMRRWKSREMLRIGLRDLVLNASPHEITSEIAYLAGSCLSLACEEVGTKLRPISDRIQFTVLGMGKFGGAEMHYSSDCDVVFSYQAPSPFEGAAALATTWGEELMRFMSERTEDGVAFELDPRLRPEGRSGALAPSVTAYREYFENPTHGIAIWERQALTRARYVAGDAETAARLLSAIRHAAFPETWQPEWSDELRHIKGRVENERAAKGEVYDVKLGPGALSDIEFSAQWLALRHGATFPDLQTTHTLGQITAAEQAELLPAIDAETLRNAYTFLRRAELRLQITQEHAVHSVKHGSKEFAAWARSVFPDEPREVATARFEEEWQQHTGAARKVMERVRDGL